MASPQQQHKEKEFAEMSSMWEQCFNATGLVVGW